MSKAKYVFYTIGVVIVIVSISVGIFLAILNNRWFILGDNDRKKIIIDHKTKTWRSRADKRRLNKEKKKEKKEKRERDKKEREEERIWLGLS